MSTVAYAGTFSIIGFDRQHGEMGIAIQSKLLAIGAFSPYAKANIGAIVTQGFINPTYGEKGLRYLEQGYKPQTVLDMLLMDDQDAPLRNLAVMDAHGNSAVFTGKLCPAYADSIQGKDYCIQGNQLAGPQVLEQMENMFNQQYGCLAERLIAALEAGQQAGGDSRGQQAAALLIVKQDAGYYGYGDRYIDLRVDDHPYPIQELRRLYTLHRLYFSKSKPEDVIPLDREKRDFLTKILIKEGLLAEQNAHSPDAFYQALIHLHRLENVLARLPASGFIDKHVYTYLLNRF